MTAETHTPVPQKAIVALSEADLGGGVVVRHASRKVTDVSTGGSPALAARSGPRCDHGRADSSWPARRNRVTSSPYRPRKWTPIGRPASFQKRGTDIAGLPVRFATTPAYATVLPPARAARSGSPAVEVISPIVAGGIDSVGVSQTSIPVSQWPTPRAKAWQSSIACR